MSGPGTPRDQDPGPPGDGRDSNGDPHDGPFRAAPERPPAGSEGPGRSGADEAPGEKFQPVPGLKGPTISRGAAGAFGASETLMGGLIGLGLLGYLLDLEFGTSPVFVLTGLGIALIVGFYGLYKVMLGRSSRLDPGENISPEEERDPVRQSPSDRQERPGKHDAPGD